MSKELLNALDALETEKGIKKEVIIDALEQALVSAYKKNYGQAQNVKVTFDARRGDIKVFAVKEVVNEVWIHASKSACLMLLKSTEPMKSATRLILKLLRVILAELRLKLPSRSSCSACAKKSVK